VLRDPDFRSLLHTFEKANFDKKTVSVLLDIVTGNSKEEYPEFDGTLDVCLPSGLMYHIKDGEISDTEYEHESMFHFDKHLEIGNDRKLMCVLHNSYLTSPDFNHDLTKILKYIHTTTKEK
jgi:hypothetical protein